MVAIWFAAPGAVTPGRLTSGAPRSKVVVSEMRVNQRPQTMFANSPIKSSRRSGSSGSPRSRPPNAAASLLTRDSGSVHTTSPLIRPSKRTLARSQEPSSAANADNVTSSHDSALALKLDSTTDDSASWSHEGDLETGIPDELGQDVANDLRSKRFLDAAANLQRAD